MYSSYFGSCASSLPAVRGQGPYDRRSATGSQCLDQQGYAHLQFWTFSVDQWTTVFYFYVLFCAYSDSIDSCTGRQSSDLFPVVCKKSRDSLAGDVDPSKTARVQMGAGRC